MNTDHRTAALHMYWREHARSIGLRSKLATSVRYWDWRRELDMHPELPAARDVAAIAEMLDVFEWERRIETLKIRIHTRYEQIVSLIGKES